MNVERLEKLESYLREVTDKRQWSFDFDMIHNMGYGEPEIRDVVKDALLENPYADVIVLPKDIALTCNTCGCAIGELPVCFPDDFSFIVLRLNEQIVLRTSGCTSDDCYGDIVIDRDLGSFFGVSDYIIDCLFYPAGWMKRVELGFPYGLQDDNITQADEVAENIRYLIDNKDKFEI